MVTRFVWRILEYGVLCTERNVAMTSSANNGHHTLVSYETARGRVLGNLRAFLSVDDGAELESVQHVVDMRGDIMECALRGCALRGCVAIMLLPYEPKARFSFNYESPSL